MAIRQNLRFATVKNWLNGKLLRRFEDTHIIKVDGGLGSQIVKYSLFEWTRNNDNPVFLDTSYYYEKRDSASSVYVHRDWSLSRYGIDCPPYYKSRNHLIPRDEVFVRKYTDDLKALSEHNYFLNSLFPIRRETLVEATDKFNISLEAIESSIVVHIRQGDFLYLASKIMLDSYYAKCLFYLKQIGLLKKGMQVILVSDSKVEFKDFSETLQLLAKVQCIVKLEVNSDVFLTHVLFRKCRILVSSNSAYSFSAVMFRKDKISLLPVDFYNGRASSLNGFFNSVSNFALRI